MKNNKLIILIILFIIIILLCTIIVIKLSENNRQITTNEINNINEIQNNNNQTFIKGGEENIEEGSNNMNIENEKIKINLIVNNKAFIATLDNNETTKELISRFPMTLNMSEMNSNEKYNYLDSSLPTNSKVPSTINAGDIKLYSNNCLVVFYKSFNTSYSYTDLGKVDDVNNFVSELGKGNVSITFEVAN